MSTPSLVAAVHIGDWNKTEIKPIMWNMGPKFTHFPLRDVPLRLFQRVCTAGPKLKHRTGRTAVSRCWARQMVLQPLDERRNS